jgi:hypothetical protein
LLAGYAHVCVFIISNRQHLPCCCIRICFCYCKEEGWKWGEGALLSSAAASDPSIRQNPSISTPSALCVFHTAVCEIGGRRSRDVPRVYRDQYIVKEWQQHHVACIRYSLGFLHLVVFPGEHVHDSRITFSFKAIRYNCCSGPPFLACLALPSLMYRNTQASDVMLCVRQRNNAMICAGKYSQYVHQYYFTYNDRCVSSIRPRWSCDGGIRSTGDDIIKSV